MLDIKTSADYLSRAGTFSNFSMLFAGNYNLYILIFSVNNYKKTRTLSNSPSTTLKFHITNEAILKFWK